jgi:hypothetical protein
VVVSLHLYHRNTVLLKSSKCIVHLYLHVMQIVLEWIDYTFVRYFRDLGV